MYKWKWSIEPGAQYGNRVELIKVTAVFRTAAVLLPGLLYAEAVDQHRAGQGP
jgi:hypothetical protein